MEILKHGKVEMRKFVCPKCECEFVANAGEKQLSTDYYVRCPCCQDRVLWWDDGEPYEEPALYVEKLVAFLETNGFKLNTEPKKTV